MSPTADSFTLLQYGFQPKEIAFLIVSNFTFLAPLQSDFSSQPSHLMFYWHKQNSWLWLWQVPTTSAKTKSAIMCSECNSTCLQKRMLSWTFRMDAILVTIAVIILLHSPIAQLTSFVWGKLECLTKPGWALLWGKLFKKKTSQAFE